MYSQNKQLPISEQTSQNSRVIKLQSIMQKQFEIEHRPLISLLKKYKYYEKRFELFFVFVVLIVL
jgi:hypothetical protein